MPYSDLTAAVRAGDERAYQSLYNEYVPYLNSYLSRRYRSLSPQSIEDAIHEVLLRIWIKRDTWNPTCVPAYLTAAVKFQAIDNFRRRQNSDDYMTEIVTNPPDGVPSFGAIALASSDDSSEHLAIHRSIMDLPDVEREVCILHFYEERTPGAIVKITKIRNKEVRRIIDDARQHLAVALHASGFKSYLKALNRERESQSLPPITESPFAKIIDLIRRMKLELEQRPGLYERLNRNRYSYAAFSEYSDEELAMLREITGTAWDAVNC